MSWHSAPCAIYDLCNTTLKAKRQQLPSTPPQHPDEAGCHTMVTCKTVTEIVSGLCQRSPGLLLVWWALAITRHSAVNFLPHDLKARVYVHPKHCYEHSK